MEKNKHRLPNHIIPIRYELVIKPDLDKFVFDGEEKIFLKINKPIKELILHSKELKIFDANLQISNSKFLISKQSSNPKSETITFYFKKLIPKGEGELSLKFKGVLNDKMRGFYRSRFIHKGVEKHLATTQFEATDARRAFPCFDEPAQKAIFDVSVIIPKGKTVVSNSIELESKVVPEHGSGFKIVKFAPTPKMSTYLLAFIVGDLEYIESKTKRGVVVRVFTTPGKKHQAKYALDCACRSLDFYEKYFDIKYPLPVLDMIAIPDFTSGAMENWGAITYRESALLVDDSNSSAQNKQWVALVIAHEIAHQWFGNLVTMHWWTDLWLNEGFASYIEYLAVDHMFPKWDIWTQFMSADLGPAFRLDSLKNTHPIEVEVKHPDEIGEIFDAVSYSKGASVIRMLAEYLGQKSFQKGLRHYLKKHSYKNTKTEDLWQALENASKKPVIKIMQNWTKCPGYPVVEIIKKSAGLEIYQSRFYSSRISRKLSKKNYIWQIPIGILVGKNVSKLLFKERKLFFKSDTEKAVKLNIGETGMFRTNYSEQMILALKSLVINKQLPILDRLGLVRDAFALAESGQMQTQTALEFALAYKHESDYTIWAEIASGLSKIDNLLFGSSAHKLFQKFALNVYSEIIKKTSWKKQKKETHTQTLLRSLILSQVGLFGHQKTIAKAKELFKRSKIDPDIRGVVYRLVAENGSKKEHAKIVKLYKSSSLHEEKNRLGHALASFKNPSLILKSLKFSKTNFVRAQDMPGIIVSAWQNPHGKEPAWNFVKGNIKYLTDRFALGGHMLARILSPAGIFNSSKKAKEFKAFFKKHPAPGAKRTIAQVLEKIYSNEAWLREDGKKIEKWLKKNYEN